MDKSALEGVRENGAIGAVDRIAINGGERSENLARKKRGDCTMESGFRIRTVDLQRPTAKIDFRTRRGKLTGGQVR